MWKSTCLAVAFGLVGGSVCAQMQLPAAPSGVVTSTSYGIEFSIFTATGNAPYLGPTFTGNTYGRGTITDSFRISRTEVTVGQYFQFVQAFAPYYAGTQPFVDFIGRNFIYQQGVVTDPSTYHIAPGYDDRPMDMTWRFAAMYCNWLHNGQSTARSAFMTGAYDVTTFTGYVEPGGTHLLNDQLTHSPGARYWIPTLDQWMAAVYYDAHRNAPNSGGWWQYPNRSNTPLAEGPPGVGEAQYNAVPWFTLLPVSSYPSVQTPWGLLDAGGGLSEWTEECNGNGIQRMRMGGGSYEDFGLGVFSNSVGTSQLDNPISSLNGLRLASVVPSPSTAVFVMFGAALIRRSIR